MKFRLTFKDYAAAWHQDVIDRIKRLDAEMVSQGLKPDDHGLYYSAQFDDIPFAEWEKMFGEFLLSYDKEFVEFEL